MKCMILEILTSWHINFCFCTFDIFTAIVVRHIAVQFTLLGCRFQDVFARDFNDEKLDASGNGALVANFQHCLHQHLEIIFKYAFLCQIFASSLAICIPGFHVIATCHSVDTGMAHATTRYFSVRITRWLMEIVGFWNAQTIREQLRLRFNFVYMLLVLVSSLCVELLDLYYSRHNLNAFTYAACSTIPVIVVLIKTVTFSIRQKEVMWLIEHCEKHFWNQKYDHFEKNALHQLDKRAVLIMLSFTILINATTVTYGVAPLVENIGKSAADRILPFTFDWFGLPISTTPLYEMLFVLEMVLATHMGVYFCCFDNFLCMLCMHISEQFKILQHRLETLLARDSFKKDADKTYDELKHCVARHRLLILYVEKLECTFRYLIMSQLLISSVVLCISGFQLCLEHQPLMKRLLFATYFFGGIFQIFLITFNSNNIIVQSDAVGSAVYNCNWEASSYKRYKKLRKHLLIIMARTKRPCYLSAGKFFPVSLESFMKVISTTASYFALLRELDIDSEEQ